MLFIISSQKTVMWVKIFDRPDSFYYIKYTQDIFKSNLSLKIYLEGYRLRSIIVSCFLVIY